METDRVKRKLRERWDHGIKGRANVAVLHDGMGRGRHNKEERNWSTHVREGREDRCTSVACIHAESQGRGRVLMPFTHPIYGEN